MDIENKPGKTMTSRFTICLLAMLASACAGCSDVRPTYVGRADPYSPRQIQFTSGELQNDTAVSGAPVLSRDPSGYLHVQVAIRSAIDKDLYVDYKTQFFDAAGVAIETTEWHTVVLPANAPFTVSDVCTSPAAANFQMTFRYAR
jgi:uncharacterized protein YcfL